MPLENIGIGKEHWPSEYPKATKDTLLVCAGGHSVWDDLQRVGFPNHQPESQPYDIMCINDVYMHFPGRVLHFYSNDRSWMPKWLAARRELYTLEFGGAKYTHSLRHGAAYNWPWPGHGTSSLNGVYCGLAMGYAKIILCGVPLDNGPHYFEAPWRKTRFENEVPNRENGTMAYWTNAKNRVFDGRVFSMSGRTRDLLGEPVE